MTGVANTERQTFEAKNEQFLGESGIALAFQPPLSPVQIENLRNQWTGADLDPQESHTRIFITNDYARQLFGDSVYVMSNNEIGAKLLRLTEKEGSIDGK